jgi:hypothetical protein
MDDSLKELLGEARHELKQARRALENPEPTSREIGMHDCYRAARKCALTVLAAREGRRPRHGEALIGDLLARMPDGPKDLSWLDRFHTFAWEGQEAGSQALTLAERAVSWAETTLAGAGSKAS